MRLAHPTAVACDAARASVQATACTILSACEAPRFRALPRVRALEVVVVCADNQLLALPRQTRARPEGLSEVLLCAVEPR